MPDAIIREISRRFRSQWQDGIPSNKAQEWVSLAYVQAIVAQAGLNTMFTEWDDGVDIYVGASKPLHGHLPGNSWIALQIKSTQTWTDDGDGIRYFLRRPAWEKLVQGSNMRQFLVVYPIPNDRGTWFTSSPRQGTLRHSAFCIAASDLPNTCNESGVTVALPASTLLTSAMLINMLYDAAEPAGATGGGA